ncbi:MAG: DUF3750 domain-containing protein [Bacteroidetes bacterium]|jgi:hypothetical protein|nr:DUF3750 domain-containing protein [Bacteroidota bacterium]
MKEKRSYQSHEIASLVNPYDAQIFFLYSPLPFPVSFAVHCWVVTNMAGKLDRWEVWQSTGQCETSRGYVHQNLFPPFQALHINFFVRSLGRCNPRLLHIVQDHNLADKMIAFIKKEAFQYPYRHDYFYYPGPNSNTFVQWIIDQFPEYPVVLPKGGLGKGYRR